MFSGLFGPPPPKSPGDAALQQAGIGGGGAPGKKDKDPEGKYEGGGFDPTGLERAAKAAKVLNQSRFAKESLELIQEQEKTKQMEFGLQQTQYQAFQQKQKMDHLAQKYKEDTEYLRQSTAEKKKLAEHQNDMNFRMEHDKLRAQKAMHEKQMQDQLKNFQRQEEMRRKTIEKEAKLREEVEMKKVAEEVKGRIQQEQENHDLHIANAKLKAAEDRRTQLESIKLAAETTGAGIKYFLSDSKQMTAAAVTLSALALGIFGARESTRVVGKFVEARLGKPELVRETSRRSPTKQPLQWLKSLVRTVKSEDALSGVVLQEKLQSRLLRVAKSTQNTKQNKAPFRHLLLYGPPGTGKTLFAKGLARHSGLEYAILTGGDVAPLGRDGVTEIHKVFDWAKASRKGLLLFIDEADAFLRKRSTENMSEDLRNALNAFLYNTGEPTNKFMIVYASNQPEQFDWAINDRIDEMVEFDLPGLEERRKMIELYVNKYLRGIEVGGAASSSTPTKIILEGIDDALLDSVAERTEGFSGREIAKLAIAWQSSAYGSVDATFTPELLELNLEAHKEQKVRKQAWAGNSLEYRK
jgi:ATPase family AAA domain-containing protein 3A/B